MKLTSAFIGLLMVCAATCASAQDSPSEDNRTQYPPFMLNSYFTVNLGSIRYIFSGDQLAPGFRAESIDIPHLAARIDLFGHHFTKHLSTQVTYLRPARYVVYKNINGDGASHQISTAYGGLTLVWESPLSTRISAYGEGGWGVTSRSGFDIDGKTALQAAHFTAGLLGAGLAYHATPNVDIMFGATYSPSRKSFAQPSTRLFTSGLRYHMRPIPDAEVEDNRHGFAFPLNVIRLGYSTNVPGYGVNNFFSKTVPIFWGGNVETRRGFTLDYQRNMFHTKKVFAFDLGASASYWTSDGNREIFRTLGISTLRFFARREPADLYFAIRSRDRPPQPGRRRLETGERFTFQDPSGVILRKTADECRARYQALLNGNVFTKNAGIKIPLTLTLGLASNPQLN